MSEQVLMPNMAGAVNSQYRQKAQDYLEKARFAHEKYLMGKKNTDLQEAIDCYIDAVKYDPSIPETYYRLASLMWEQGQISINSAIEQCQTAVSLSPQSVNAHLYTGYFMQISHDYQSAQNEYQKAIHISGINSGRSRMIMSQSILDKINTVNGNFSDYIRFLYYFLSGSVMLAWDRTTIKMFYKNIASDMSVFSYSTVGKFLEQFKMYKNANNVYKNAIEKTPHREYFTSEWEI
jgi:tetratricopeptide (TPR) repeat protein